MKAVEPRDLDVAAQPSPAMQRIVQGLLAGVGVVIDRGGDRAAHMEWAKSMARRSIARGDLLGAFLRFADDMGKHPATRADSAIAALMQPLIRPDVTAAELLALLEEIT